MNKDAVTPGKFMLYIMNQSAFNRFTTEISFDVAKNQLDYRAGGTHKFSNDVMAFAKVTSGGKLDGMLKVKFNQYLQICFHSGMALQGF